MKMKTARFAAATVITLVVISGMTFWPGRGTDGKKWWLAPPAAWSQEIINALDTFKCVTRREQIVFVLPDGSKHTSRNWNILYVSNDSYRRDIFDKDFLREIQWYVPEGDGTRQHIVHFELESYFIQTDTGRSYGNNDPIDKLRSYVELLDEADRQLGAEVIDGCECVGFEISASKYGDNGDTNREGWTDRIWFDVETKLPVRIEIRGLPVTGNSEWTITIIQDQFDYDPGLPPETFVPYTPEGFVFGHPDEIQAAEEK